MECPCDEVRCALQCSHKLHRGAFHMPLPVWNFILTTGGALLSLPCVRGGAE